MRGIKDLRESLTKKYNGDVKKMTEELVNIFTQEIKEKKLDPKQVSFKALFEGLVDLEGIDKNDAVRVAEAVASSSFTQITTVITSAIIIEPYTQRMVELSALFTEGTAKMTNDETVRGMTAVGGVRRRIETEAYDETDFDEKYVTIRKSDFGRIIALTMEDIFNDATGDIAATANTIGEDAISHKEQMVVETLECLPRTAFNEATTRAFVYKGTAIVQGGMYASTHVGVAGLDNQVNCNTATGGVTEAGFKLAYDNFAKLVDERGKKITIKPKVAIVHSTNELVLATLLGTDQVVGSAYNDINQFGPRGRVQITPFTSVFLATTTGLCYFGDPKRQLLWLDVQKPKTITMAGTDDDAFRRQIVWKARFNYYGGIGHRDYRYVTRLTTS